MKIIFRGLLLIWFAAGFVTAGEAPELAGLRKSYEDAIGRAIRPITLTYLKELEKLRDTYTRNAKLAAANEVQAEIDALNQKLTATELGAPVTQGGQTTVLNAVALIPANDVNGYKLGPIRSGDVITLTYVGGKWKDHGGIGTEDPDAAKCDEKSRLVIATATRGKRPGTVIKVVPPGTAQTPFSHRLPTSMEDVVLRIQGNSDNKSNPGQVTYKVTITR